MKMAELGNGENQQSLLMGKGEVKDYMASRPNADGLTPDPLIGEKAESSNSFSFIIINCERVFTKL